MLMTLASQLDELNDEDVMSTSSKGQAPSAKASELGKNNLDDLAAEDDIEAT